MKKLSGLDELASIIYDNTSLPEAFDPSDSVILRTEFVGELTNWLHRNGFVFDDGAFFDRCMDDTTKVR